MRKPDAPVVLMLALAAFAWLPLATPGYFMRAHDAPHSLFFLQAFDAVIRDGHWWPAWGPHFAFGYGYPLWIFYAPLTYFLGEAFHLLGASLTTAMKLVDLVATLGATLAMYGWARRHFGGWGAAFAALVYTYAPYHLLDLYVRSAAAEYLTFVFFPLALWRWEALVEAPGRRNAILAALVTAGLILTHHGAAFIFAMLLASYIVFALVVRLRAGGVRWLSLIGHGAAAAVLTLGLSAIFWLPMLLEQRYIVVEQWTSVAYNYQKHFVYLNQFFSPFWGYGYSGEGLADDMAFQLGLLPVCAAIVALVLPGRQRARTGFFLAASALVVIAMSPVSAGFWFAVPIASLVQFPWRLLALSAITLAWLAGAALDGFMAADGRDGMHAALLMIVIALASAAYTLPQYTARSLDGESARASVDFELVSYRDRTGYMTWASEQPQRSPLVEEYQSGAPLTRAVVVSGDAQIEPLYYGGEVHRLRVRAAGEAVIQFRVYYFPGWRAYVDGQPAALWPAGPQALNTLAAPPGDHTVELRFEHTLVRAVAKGTTVVSLLGMLAWIGFGWWRKARRGALPAALLVLIAMLAACGSDPTPTATVAVTSAPPATATDAPAPPTPTATSTPAPTATATATARPATTQYTVQPNDTLGAIALKFGTTAEAIMQANGITDPRFVRVGQVLTIPLPTPTPTATLPPTLDPRLPSPTPGPTPIIYVVKPGDVLSAIAVKYGIPVDEIMRANGMSDTLLRVGQQLIIPGPTPTPTITQTPLPTATPTAGLPFAAPVLLYPANSAVLTSTEAIVMNWTAVGVLADDQYYVLRVRSSDGARSENVWLKAPSYRLSPAWKGSQVEWDVTILQQTRVNPNGSREGRIASPMSATRTFTWK
ncbi:MAG: LysM peptidoglycan-binding domain-containing protein [Chloroflexi bacterium]|nr:LysM peptidoglycan-binding domain-containing protein [Chloroflexota bacterium]